MTLFHGMYGKKGPCELIFLDLQGIKNIFIEDLVSHFRRLLVLHNENHEKTQNKYCV